MMVIGIRQAVKNKNFAEGNHLDDGFMFSTNVLDSSFNDTIAETFEDTSFLNIGILSRNWTIVGDPNTETFKKLRQRFELIFEVAKAPLQFTEGFNNQEDLFEFVRGNSYQRDSKLDSLLFAIELPENEDNNDYTIYQSVLSPNYVPDTNNVDLITSKPNFQNSNLFSGNGFLYIQKIIADNILAMKTGVDTSEIEVFMTSGFTNAFIRDDFMEGIGQTFPLFILLVFLAPIYRLVGFVVSEKASRSREGMKMMGLNDAPYWLSWFIYYFSICLMISLSVSVLFTIFLFKNSSFILLFLYFVLYGMSLFSFNLVICAFLQRPKIACILATLLHFLTFFANAPVDNGDTSIVAKAIISILPNGAMSQSMQALTALEARGLGLTGSTISMVIGNYKVVIAFIMWTIVFFLLGLLSLYLDNVLPKEFGKRQPWYFFVSKKYWTGSDQRAQNGNHQRLLDQYDEELSKGSKDFEAVPDNIRQLEKQGDCMKVNNLVKVYGSGKKAVDGLSLTMYKDQIFALLGHNGAGKTTTLSILTGLYQPTEGNASVFNIDMFGEVEKVRKILGICPQFDILFEMLNPIEHLQFYCMMKGVPVSEIPDEVEKTIKDVDLESKKYAYAKNLSGGQKRKLSVGIAMIGGSKLILLDEPTSGMDLTARRKIWDMLKNNKKDKIIILTTHFMDEADILGDRIAIMASGNIKCCGGSLFLKKRYGVGYNLLIAKEDKDPNNRIEEFINERLSDVTKLSEVSSEITFQIPQAESEKFEMFFMDLDENLKNLKIKSYGVGVTTLEEVFLKVGREDEDGGSRKSVSELKQEIEETKNEKSSKSLNHSGEMEQVDEYSIAENSVENVFWLHFGALVTKRFLVSFRQLKTSLIEILIPIILIIVGLALASIDFFTDSIVADISPTVFPTPNKFNYARFNGGDSVQVDIDAFNAALLNNPAFSDLTEVTSEETDLRAFLSDFEEKVFENGAYDPDVENIGNLVFYNLDKAQSKYSLIGFSNAFGRDSAPIHMQSILNSALAVGTGQDLNYTMRLFPFPLTATATAGAKAGSGAIVAFLFSIAFAMIPAGVASAIVTERENNVKHQQFISGASMQSYWISNYVVDFIRSLIPVSVAIIFVFIFGVDLPLVWILFILFAISIHPFTYATTFWFKKENVAQTLTIMLHIFLGGFLAIVMLVLQSFPSTRSAGNVLRWFPKIIPSYCMISGILQISSRQIIARAVGDEKAKGPLDFDVAGGDALFLVLNFFLWWGILILYESGVAKSLSCRRGADSLPEATRRTENLKIDDDVQAEENR